MDLNILLSTPALTLYSIALVLFIGYIVKNKYISKQQVDQMIELTEYIQKNYIELGFKENKNLDIFLKDFVVRYNKDTGIVPTEEIVKNAAMILDKLMKEK